MTRLHHGHKNNFIKIAISSGRKIARDASDIGVARAGVGV